MGNIFLNPATHRPTSSPSLRVVTLVTVVTVVTFNYGVLAGRYLINASLKKSSL